jgi:amino acid adenylation domain-containing protein
MTLLNHLYQTFQCHSSFNFLCDDEEFYTYGDLLDNIGKIRRYIRESIAVEQKTVGIVAGTDINTYAAIFALWFEGKAYVPLLPTAPEDRNRTVVREASLTHVLSSSQFKQNLPAVVVDTNTLPGDSLQENPVEYDPSRIAYILFTSGTTGLPKGVQISLGNLSAFIDAMIDLGHEIHDTDRVLQMFELTFDFSVVSYVLPSYGGACIYTIPEGEVKFNYALDLLEEHHLTVLFLVPSVITYLQMYFDDIDEQETRLCSFCGEALTLDITNRWQKCIPNARIINFYGPTEDTVFCSYYDVNATNQKNLNDVISVGKAMKNGDMFILNENNEEAKPEERGELCLAGPQLSPGYWNNPEKNAESFFEHNGKRFYKTGDLCYMDADGDIMYVGRMDFQAKIQGFRVELSEIEHYAAEFFGSEHHSLCVAFTNKIGNTEIGMAVEGKEFDTAPALEYIKSKLPPYEVPTKVLFFERFPLNNNGKLDRKKISEKFSLI